MLKTAYLTNLTCEYVLESRLHIRRVQRRRLDKAERIALGKRLGLFGRHHTQMPQIALVAHQHDDDILVSMVAQLSQPSFHILVRQMLGDVVDEQRTDGAAIVRGRDGTVALLASGIPDLRFDHLAVDLIKDDTPMLNTMLCALLTEESYG